MPDPPPKSSAPAWLRWATRALAVLTVLLLLSAHSQVTLRHWALRVLGVRVGEVREVTQSVPPGPETSAVGGADGGAAVVVADSLLQAPPESLTGYQLQVGEGGAIVAVTGNTATTLRVDGDYEELRQWAAESGRYLLARKLGPLQQWVGWKFPAVAVTPSELLLAPALLLALLVAGGRVRTTSTGAPEGLAPPGSRLPGIARPPWALLVFLLVAAASVLPALRLGDGWRQYLDAAEVTAGMRAGAKELLQLGVVLVCGFVVWREALADPTWRRRGWALLLIAGTIVVTVGYAEYFRVLAGKTARGLADVGTIDATFGFQFNPSRPHQAGSEASRNVLAMYLAVLAPVAAAWYWAPVKWWWRAAGAVLALLALGLVLQGWLLLAALAGVLVVAALQRSPRALALTFAVLAVAVAGRLLVMPRHGAILADSVALHRHADPYGSLPEPKKGGTDDDPGWEPWQQKYVELQAALNAVTWSPLLGHGLGTYQQRINTFYTQARLKHLWHNKSPANWMEPDGHSQYAVLAVETGLAGVWTLLALLGLGLQHATRRRDGADDWDRALLAGVAGALLALLLGGLAGPFLRRGLYYFLTLLLAVPWAVGGIRGDRDGDGDGDRDGDGENDEISEVR